jgi:hypothetical protein
MTGVEEIDVTSEYKIKFLHAGHLEQVLCLQGIIAKNFSRSYHLLCGTS